ncbi:hypothetical protein GQ42DRAFT_71693 [Ramicandelaber brevisporus]|nr:hypothetical protein GQ42DRAFT_71693 [Ramicandelaber brevisporus]
MTTERAHDDVAIESSEPFPLLALPYELIEEIAAWFSRGEAVKVLTVNKTLREAFARSLWHRVIVRDNMRCLPATTWQRYGPFVRIATIYYSSRAVKTAIWMPNVQHLTLHSSPVMEEFIAIHPELRSLCSIQIDIYNVEMMGLTEWIRAAEQRGQCLQINWAFYNLHDSQYAALDHIVDSVNDISRNTICIETRYDDEAGTIRQLPKLSQMLVKLDISCMYSVELFVAQYMSLLGDTDINFPRLESLALSYDHPQVSSDHDEHVAAFKTLTPGRFPVLRRFRLEVGKPDNVVLEHLLRHTWSTVSELELTHIKDTELLKVILTHFPNVRRLLLDRITVQIDLQIIASSLPELETLILTKACYIDCSTLDSAAMPESYRATNKIKELAISAQWTGKALQLPSSFWHFLAQNTPKLEALKLLECQFRGEDLEVYSTSPLSSLVRTLVIGAGESSQLTQLVTVLSSLQILRLIDSLSNLSVSKLNSEFVNKCQRWRDRYPNICVVHRYHKEEFSL